MSSAGHLKRELRLRENSLRRWKKFLKRGSKSFRGRRLGRAFVSKLEDEISSLDREINRGEGTIFWDVRNFAKETGKYIGEVAKEAKVYLFPGKEKRKRAGVYSVLFALFFILLIFGNISYFLVFILVIILVSFCRLVKNG